MKGKNIALIFEKTSTRTRCAFEVAAYDQGAHVTYLDPSGVADRAQGVDEGHRPGARPDVRRDRVPRLRAGDGRGAGASTPACPVCNGLTDEFHPTQMLADVLTMTEHATSPCTQIVYCYLGDARNNMGNSLLVGRLQAGHGRAHLRARATSGPTRSW